VVAEVEAVAVMAGGKVVGSVADSTMTVRVDVLVRPSAASRGNVVLFCGAGNHARTCRLPGGARWIRTRDIASRTDPRTQSETPLSDAG
jgi:hypothetical protein